MELKRREGEPMSAFLYRFTKKVKQGGILPEVKRRQFKDRPMSKRDRRLSALYRQKKKIELEKARKLGMV